MKYLFEKGTKNPQYKGRIPVNCDGCGSLLEIYPYQTLKNKKHYCSRSCCRKKLEEFPCKGCGILVKRKEKAGGYCSDSCSNKHAPYWLDKQRPEMRKEVLSNWREARKILATRTEYKSWRRKVFERDNYTCQKCGARSAKGVSVCLNADHIKPARLYPELMFDVLNGRTLCEPCHRVKTSADLREMKGKLTILVHQSNAILKR